MPKFILPLVTALLMASTASGADIVKDGKPLGAIWHSGDQPEAAADLAKTIEKMSGALLEIKTGKPEAGQPAIVLGALALEMGLTAPPETKAQEGYCIESHGNHLLMAGGSPTATRFAVTDFLERQGCRWLTATPLGDVIPQRPTISLAGLKVSEKPDFIYREIWGMPRHTARLGGFEMPQRHDWQHVPASKYFATHPEYFAMRDGVRKPGGWVCTSNPDVVRIFADAYIAKAKQGVKADTISPPDGRGFCECTKCKALDVPGYFEPSNGAFCMSDRYSHFFKSVAALVEKDAPDFLLSFLCYSDYTLPPKTLDKMSKNLVGWVTTIRFCRIHGVNNPNCESRQRYGKVVNGWSKLISTCCYDYNYNLAEVTVPISKISYMKDNIPSLKKSGCLGINLESMSAWNLYGPHTYLASKLMWKADADADAILADYYEKCAGPRAAPHVKAYWDRIDKAVVECRTHCGSFNGINAIWTPELYAACDADLRAADAATSTPADKERVAMFRSGLENVRYWRELDVAINRCDFTKAQATYTTWHEHMEDAYTKQYSTMRSYRQGYLRLLKPIIESGLARVQGDRKLLVQLPDVWDFRYDPKDEGEQLEFFKQPANEKGWQPVKTYSASLNEQQIPEQLTWMWYRTSFGAPASLPNQPLHLWFGEVDGTPTRVWLNGTLLGEFTGARRPNEVEVTGKIIPGKKNEIVIKTGHLSISELMLGGLLRPVMIYAGEKPAEARAAAKK
jgi:hypothetical protein